MIRNPIQLHEGINKEDKGYKIQKGGSHIGAFKTTRASASVSEEYDYEEVHYFTEGLRVILQISEEYMAKDK